MLFLLFQVLINITLFFFLYEISVRQKENSLAQMSLLRAELKDAQEQYSIVVEQLSSRLVATEANSSSTLNSLHVFYFGVGVVVVCVSAYFIYSAFASLGIADVVFDCTKIITDASLKGDLILAESLKNIDSNLAHMNNVSISGLSSRITVLELKINDLTGQIDALAAQISPTAVDMSSAAELLQDSAEIIYTLMQ